MKVSFDEELMKEYGRCVGCGACNLPCPQFYIEDQLETAGGRARLKIPWMLGRGELEITEEILSYLFSCMNCSKCSDACPVGIDVFGVIVRTRSSIVDMGFVPLVTVDMREEIKRAGSPVGEGLVKGSWLRSDHKPKRNPDVLLFAGCWAHRDPELIKAMEKVLVSTGVSVEHGGQEEPCCGALAFVMGESDHAVDLMERTKRFLRGVAPRVTVSACSLCSWFHTDPNVVYFYGYALDAISDGRLKVKRPRGVKKVLLVPSCRESVGRDLLEAIGGFEILDGYEWICCDCGASVIYRSRRDHYKKWFEDLIEISKGLGAEMMVIEEPSCYVMINELLEGRIKYKGVKIVPLVRLVSERLG